MGVKKIIRLIFYLDIRLNITPVEDSSWDQTALRNVGTIVVSIAEFFTNAIRVWEIMIYKTCNIV